VMDRCAVLRSVVGRARLGQHDVAFQCIRAVSRASCPPGSPVAMSGPGCNLGSVAARLLGPVDPLVPAYVFLEGPNESLTETRGRTPSRRASWVPLIPRSHPTRQAWRI